MKILVFGIPGSGKTTFSNRLSEITGIPVFHIDRHFFEPGPGWKKRPHEDFLDDVRGQLEKDRWIIDGNGMRTLEMRFKEANLVIYCAQPLWKCYFRIVKRAIAGFALGRERADCPEGAANIITWRLLSYVWNFKAKYGPSIDKLHRQYPGIEFIHASSDQDLQKILDDLANRK